MGEIAEATLNGLFCEGCGEVFPDMREPGYPRRCITCRPRQAAAPAREFRRHRHPHPLRKTDRKWLAQIELLCRPGDGMEFVGGMYAGMTVDRLPAPAAHRLQKRGAIALNEPHNPIHKVRWVITDAGRAELEATA